MKQVLHLVDGNSYAYRAFYALPSFTTKGGQPTNAVYGFAMFLMRLLRESKATHAAVAFDSPKPTFRHKAFESYKAQRKPTPEELVSQFPLLRKLTTVMGVRQFTEEGVEADDVLATLAKRGLAAGMEVRIYSGDKDILQLVSPGLAVVIPRHEDEEMDAEAVKKRWGVGPERIPDFLALMGDASDNLPGVPGVGEKTAAALLEQFGSLDELYRRLPEVKSEKLREKLAGAHDQALKTRELAVLKADVPLAAGPAELALGERDEEALRSFLEEMEFHSMLKNLPAAPAGPPPSLEPASAGAGEAAPPDWGPPARHVEPDDKGLVRALGGGETVFCLPLPGQEKPWLALSAGGERWLLEFTPDAARALRGFLADGRPRKVVHGMKEMAKLALSRSITLAGVKLDTKLAAWLVRPRSGGVTPEEAATEFLGFAPPDEGDPARAAGSALACLEKLEPVLAARLKEDALEELMNGVEMPVAPVLAAMELRGIKLDASALAEVAKGLWERLAVLEAEVKKDTGSPFNLLSPKQVAEVLFQKLNLPAKRKTKTGFSTDEGVLEELSVLHAVPGKILEYRRMAKLLGTYLEPLPALCDAGGLLHTTFNQAGAATGRLSSSDPNLQNIPIKGDVGMRIRRAFVPRRAGLLLLSADYSQIELRILAHISGDEGFLGAFSRSEDIHSATAAEMFGKKSGDVTQDERRAAKAVNFGIVYGMTAFGLARELKCNAETARDFLDRWFARHPAVKGYWEATLEGARAKGFVTTLFGRRRYLPEIKAQNKNRRDEAEREALNHPIQGTAADLVKMAMARVTEDVPEAALLLQIHDELLFEVPLGAEEALQARVRKAMEGVYKLKVPLLVEAASGRNWSECHP